MALSSPSLSSKTILVVDDKVNNLQLLSACLKRANYKVLIAQDAFKAIAIAQTLQPDLILLDVMMPKMDGFAVCQQLKTDPVTHNIPIIFMTALTAPQYKVDGFRLGAIDYITKPIEEQEVLARIATHLALNHLHQASLRDAAQRRLLFDISDRIRQSLNLKEILETATKEIRTFLDCNFVGLIALNCRKANLKAYATSISSEIVPPQKIDFSSICPNGDIYQAYRQGYIEITSTPDVAQSANSFLLPDSQAQLIVPILIQDANYTSGFFSAAEETMVTQNILYGWLIVEHNTPRTWHTKEIYLLRQITTQLSIAIKQGLLHQQLSQLALLDSLTRVYNRRSFDRQLKREWGRLKRIASPLSLIMCDVDCFKIYNDTFGHQQGDFCLQQVAQAISSALKRSADVLARYGGKNLWLFCLILLKMERSR